MTYADPVSLVRSAITKATGLETTRVLEPRFTEGPMPVVHVHHLGGYSDEIDRTDQVGVDVYHHCPQGPQDPSAASAAARVRGALEGTGLDTGAGLIDEAAVSSEPVLRPYFETVEVSSMVLDVTQRPTD